MSIAKSKLVLENFEALEVKMKELEALLNEALKEKYIAKMVKHATTYVHKNVKRALREKLKEMKEIRKALATVTKEWDEA
ncbi:unnamed protein product [Dovyalis caffra]|uniref:50S ribosomal protein L29 n=1 Tax=Dovyalis caffra TaxID=77055 RepID=A0AAV1SH59_9ROSI|nr:unnamed protein product [Dovyalis caffra]